MTTEKTTRSKEDNKENKTDLAQTNIFELATMDVENVGSALLENLGGQGISSFDFDRLSFPAAGATHWTIYDSLSGEENAKKIQQS